MTRGASLRSARVAIDDVPETLENHRPALAAAIGPFGRHASVAQGELATTVQRDVAFVNPEWLVETEVDAVLP